MLNAFCKGEVELYLDDSYLVFITVRKDEAEILSLIVDLCKPVVSVSQEQVFNFENKVLQSTERKL